MEKRYLFGGKKMYNGKCILSLLHHKYEIYERLKDQ